MDMRQYASYANKNARLVYLHLACCQDINTCQSAVSYRRLARELDMTLGEVRHAVKQLQNDGLIATHIATQTIAQTTAHLTTQPTTHSTIIINNELGAPNGAPNYTPNNTPNNTPNDTPNDTQNNNKINNTEKASTHTYTREEWQEMGRIMSSTLRLPNEVGETLLWQFIERQALKQKTWDNKGDALSHLVAWCEKRQVAAARAKDQAKRTDAQARQEEHQRTQEEQAKKDSETLRLEEIAKLRRWVKDWEKESRDTTPLLKRIHELETINSAR